MRWTPSCPVASLTCCAVAVIGAAAGCSSGDTAKPSATVVPPAATPAAAPPPPRAVSTSPAGVTTKIDVPAHSTEEEYFQACHAAKLWMDGHPGDHQALVERYLAAVQQPGVVGAGTWNLAWAALPLPRQAGVIIAATAAADDACG